MISERKKDFAGMRYDVRMSGIADPESSWVRRRDVIRGALQWR